MQARCHNIFGLYRLIHWVCHLAVPFAFNNRAFRHEHLCIGRVADGRDSCACFPDNRFAGLPISEGRAGVWVGVCGRYVSVRGCACVRVCVRAWACAWVCVCVCVLALVCSTNQVKFLDGWTQQTPPASAHGGALAYAACMPASFLGPGLCIHGSLRGRAAPCALHYGLRLLGQHALALARPSESLTSS